MRYIATSTWSAHCPDDNVQFATVAAQIGQMDAWSACSPRCAFIGFAVKAGRRTLDRLAAAGRPEAAFVHLHAGSWYPDEVGSSGTVSWSRVIFGATARRASLVPASTSAVPVAPGRGTLYYGERWCCSERDQRRLGRTPQLAQIGEIGAEARLGTSLATSAAPPHVMMDAVMKTLLFFAAGMPSSWKAGQKRDQGTRRPGQGRRPRPPASRAGQDRHHGAAAASPASSASKSS